MATLAQLPNELFKRIVELLSRKSICTMRLVSRQISHKTNQKKFKSLFRTARVKLTISHLESFAEAAAGVLGDCIQNIHFVGIVYAPRETEFRMSNRAVPPTADALSQARANLRLLLEQRAAWASSMADGVPLALLRRALDHIDRRSRQGVQTLHIKIKVVTEPHKPPVVVQDMACTRSALLEVYRVASETFTLVMGNMLEGRLSKTHKMSIFATNPHLPWDHRGMLCSLPSDVLTEVLGDISPTDPSALVNVRSLAISTVPPRAALSTDNPEDFENAVRQGNLLWGHTKLLQACPNVEILRLGIEDYPLIMGRTRLEYHCRYIAFGRQIMHMAESIESSRLRILHLCAFGATDIQIAALFTAVRHTLQRAALISVDVYGAVVGAVLPLMDGTCSKLKTFDVEDLFENGNGVNYDHFVDQLSLSGMRVKVAGCDRHRRAPERVRYNVCVPTHPQRQNL